MGDWSEWSGGLMPSIRSPKEKWCEHFQETFWSPSSVLFDDPGVGEGANVPQGIDDCVNSLITALRENNRRVVFVGYRLLRYSPRAIFRFSENGTSKRFLVTVGPGDKLLEWQEISTSERKVIGGQDKRKR